MPRFTRQQFGSRMAPRGPQQFQQQSGGMQQGQGPMPAAQGGAMPGGQQYGGAAFAPRGSQ